MWLLVLTPHSIQTVHGEAVVLEIARQGVTVLVFFCANVCVDAFLVRHLRIVLRDAQLLGVMRQKQERGLALKH